MASRCGPRWLGVTGRELTLEADLVVDASGLTDSTGQPGADGLLVIGAGATAGGTGPAAGGRARAAALVAAVLDRCLTEHLSRSPDLTGLSVLATQAVARSGAATPDGHEQAADAAVEAC